jgi:hypothetical protein
MEASPYGYLPLGSTSLKRTSYDFQDSVKPAVTTTGQEQPIAATGNSKAVWIAVITSVSIIVLLIVAIIIVIVINSKKDSNQSESDIVISRKKKDVLMPDAFDPIDDQEEEEDIPHKKKHSEPRDLQQVYDEIQRQDQIRYSPDDRHRRVRFADPEVTTTYGPFESPGKIMKFQPLGDQSGFASL